MTTLLPILKVKTPLTASDTRPIAQLPEMSKILERIVHDQLVEHLHKRKLLRPRQAGFRRGHSTQTALLGLLDDVRYAIDKRRVTILVLFDFSKAFDTIPHVLLLKKLRAINCSDGVIKWFYNYLADRLQSVIDEGGSPSEWLRSITGVPQGSVLGPLLFSIFINDLPNVLKHTNHMIFADDTQICYHCEPCDLEEGIAAVSRDANAVAQ